MKRTSALFPASLLLALSAGAPASQDAATGAVDLAVGKTVDDPTPDEGDPIIYTVVLTNNGPENATGVVLTDSLPQGVTLESSAATQGFYDGDTKLWTVGTVPVSAADTLTIAATVDEGTAGTTIVNTASVSAVDQPDFEPSNDSSTADIIVANPDSLPVVGHEELRDLGSGPYDNAGGDTTVMWSVVVSADDDLAPWMRVHFDQIDLGPGDFLRFTALEDTVSYEIKGCHAQEPGGYSSFYLNGSSIQVELVALPGGTGAGVHIDLIDVGDVSGGALFRAPESICDADDRLPTSDVRVARLVLKIGVGIFIGSGQLISDDGCIATAGHCLSGVDFDSPGDVITQFNVPPSTAQGNYRNPDPSDQYSIDIAALICFEDGGVGNDWGVFHTLPNSSNASTAQGDYFRLATSLPTIGANATRTGYGADDEDTRNFVQQSDTDPVVSATGSRIRYLADSRGGDSGGALVDGSTGRLTGIHTHGGCPNSSTSVTHPASSPA